MPDLRKHRGPHPEDKQLFAAENGLRLCSATRDLSWLLSQGYASPSSLKLVGDRYSLDKRQRLAVARCACSTDKMARRERHQVRPVDLDQQELWLDGYNVLTTLEAALSGGVILCARDGCYRDMASMYGNYRTVNETIPAIDHLGKLLFGWNVGRCHWFLDQPVSNSGRLKKILLEIARKYHWNWQVELVPNPDTILAETDQIVASADSQILDHTHRWLNLARLAIEKQIGDAWIVDLSALCCL